MRVLFLILAHHEPQQLAELAQTLVSAGSNAEALIHFDGNARREDFELLEKATAHSDRIRLVRERIACKWGDYSLVQAVINGLCDARASSREYDYVVLLSGSCLPCRPIRQLERYLHEHNGTEFIEACDETWITGGLRRERHEFYYPVPASPTKSRIENSIVALQRRLKIKRKAPADLDVKFGSQWWGLTWQTCLKLLDFMAENPSVEAFFRKTYIPDEMVFPTIVNHLAAPRVGGFGLTFFQFTNFGKPVTFYDDHRNYPFTLDRFFFRKASSEAVNLRRTALAIARAADGGEDLSGIGRPNTDYRTRIDAQINHPVPGQIFYRDQFCDVNAAMVRRLARPYVIVCGLPSQVDTVLSALDPRIFETFGRLYKAGDIDFGKGRSTFGGLRRNGVHIRDMHPFLFLVRILQRTDKIPVLSWAPGDCRRMLEGAIDDPHALVISLPPIGRSAKESADRWRQSISAPCRQGDRKPSSDPNVTQPQTPVPIHAALLSGIGGHYDARVLACPRPRDATPAEMQACADIYRQSFTRLKHRSSAWLTHIHETLASLTAGETGDRPEKHGGNP